MPITKGTSKVMRFLIIDDSSVDRHALASLLGALGHVVDQYDSPALALNKIETGVYDVVFLDVVMPDQDGYRFLRSLRMNLNTAKQYVVFCSTKRTQIEMNYGINRAGANDYLPKPATRESIEQVLARIPTLEDLESKS
jgi:CheY-like chemotaxis protein